MPSSSVQAGTLGSHVAGAGQRDTGALDATGGAVVAVEVVLVEDAAHASTKQNEPTRILIGSIYASPRREVYFVACFEISVNAAGSLMARSLRILRSSPTLAFLRPLIRREYVVPF